MSADCSSRPLTGWLISCSMDLIWCNDLATRWLKTWRGVGSGLETVRISETIMWQAVELGELMQRSLGWSELTLVAESWMVMKEVRQMTAAEESASKRGLHGVLNFLVGEERRGSS